MKIDEAIKVYKTGYQLCKALGIASQNYNYWVKVDAIPELQQWRLMFLTNGELMVDQNFIDRLLIKKSKKRRKGD